MWGWISVSVVVIAVLVAGFFTASDPASVAQTVFPLFLVALIAAGLRVILRRPHV